MKGWIIAATLFCVGLVGGAVWLTIRANDTSGPRLVPLSTLVDARVKEGAWGRDADNAKVTLLEYGDFQCPACGAMFPILQETEASTKDFVRFQFRQYPLTQIHPNALQAALGAEAAGRQGQFWAMHDKLYTEQTSWADLAPSAFRTQLEQYAQDLGLNVEQFKRDVRDAGVASLVQQDRDKGTADAVDGTPTLLVNGKKIDLPANAQQLIQILRTAAGVTG